MVRRSPGAPTENGRLLRVVDSQRSTDRVVVKVFHGEDAYRLYASCPVDFAEIQRVASQVSALSADGTLRPLRFRDALGVDHLLSEETVSILAELRCATDGVEPRPLRLYADGLLPPPAVVSQTADAATVLPEPRAEAATSHPSSGPPDGGATERNQRAVDGDLQSALKLQNAVDATEARDLQCALEADRELQCALQQQITVDAAEARDLQCALQADRELQCALELNKSADAAEAQDLQSALKASAELHSVTEASASESRGRLAKVLELYRA